MFENILNFFRKFGKNDNKETSGSKSKAKERLHLVLMQDRANVSADFLELMKQEIIDVIKKYIEVEESEIDVRLTNEVKEDGTTGAPSLYANIPILNIRNDMKKEIEEEKRTDNTKIEQKNDNKKEEIEALDSKEEEQQDNEDEEKDMKVETESKEEEIEDNRQQDDVVQKEANIVVEDENKE